jgi:aquaporin Z
MPPSASPQTVRESLGIPHGLVGSSGGAASDCAAGFSLLHHTTARSAAAPSGSFHRRLLAISRKARCIARSPVQPLRSHDEKLFAGFLGTFWLVFGGCGSAVLAAGFPELGIGFVGVSLAFGLTVLTMAYSVGHISGGHFNPAVSLGLAVARRFSWADLPGYWAAQVLGGLLAAFVLYLIASGAPEWTAGGFASNGYGALSPGGYGLTAAFLLEVVLTAAFLLIILGATSARAPAGFAPIAIGLALTLIHLISIPVTNTSVNPARSTAVVAFAETAALGQLWLFWVAPLIGAVVGAAIWAYLEADRELSQAQAASSATAAE